jgi:hypothetical protein
MLRVAYRTARFISPASVFGMKIAQIPLTEDYYMHERCGIWVSHKEAVIVKLSSDSYSIDRIESQAERRHKSTGGVRGKSPYAHRSAISGARDEENRRNDWKRHYQSILKALPQDAEILVMGPGPAKSGFVAFLKEHAGPTLEVVGVQPAAHMTQGQLVERVKTAFGQETRAH